MAKKAPEWPPPGAPAWMATYGDLVTLLLCFFVLLFATSNVDVAKFQEIAQSFNKEITFLEAGGSQGMNELVGSGIMELPRIDKSINDSKEKNKKVQEELSKLASDFKTYFAEKDLSQDVEVTVAEDHVKITFGDGVLFDSGQATLKPSAMEALDAIASELLNHPNNAIKVEGHTDNIPINTAQFPDNMYLSAARSISVLNHFKDVHGFNPERLSQEGFGEYAPIESNDTQEGRAKNRRVDVKIMSSFTD